MPTRKWCYPVASSYHMAMASAISSYVNLPYFLDRAYSRERHALELVAHNINQYHVSQANAIGWASKD